MRNEAKSFLLTALFSAVALFFTGCGGCVEEAARKAANEVRNETREQTTRLQQQLNDAARQNEMLQETISRAQDEIERLKTDHNHRVETEQRLWGYARLFVYIIGILTCLQLLGKPLYRVTAALLLRVLPLEPREIIQGANNETRMEQN